MLPPVRARNIIPGRLSDHEMPERVVMLSEKARISNAELITKTDFGPAEGSMGGNVRRIWRVAAAAPDLRTKSGL